MLFLWTQSTGTNRLAQIFLKSKKKIDMGSNFANKNLGFRVFHDMEIWPDTDKYKMGFLGLTTI